MTSSTAAAPGRFALRDSVRGPAPSKKRITCNRASPTDHLRSWATAKTRGVERIGRCIADVMMLLRNRVADECQAPTVFWK